MRAGIAIALAACSGGHATAIDAPPADASAACTATWTGNFAEVATSAAPCASIDSGLVVFDAPSGTLAKPLTVAIQLATSAIGSYSSETVATWSANETRMILGNTCVYEAGAMTTPHGDFTLKLDDAEAPHGTLQLDLVVLAGVVSVCGTPLTETLELAF